MEIGVSLDRTGAKETDMATLTAKHKPYPSYKPSGVEWLGDVPAHWEVRRASRLFSIGSGTTPPSERSEYYGGDIPWVTTSELRETIVTSTETTITEEALRNFPALNIFPEGSIAVAMYGATIGRLGILGVPATVNQACCVFSEPKGVNAGFWFYWLQSRRHYLILRGQGGGQPNLSQKILRSIRVPTPPLGEQAAIATFLDRETEKIDALISKKERLIELLQEKRTALISHTVTKGLDPNVPLKDSCVEWLGDVPAHWEVRRASRLFSIGSGTTPPSERSEYYGGDIPWVTTSELRETIVTSTETTITEEALRNFPALNIFPEGSIAVAMYGATIGRLGILGVPATVNQACCVFSEPKGVNAGFWFYWLQSRRHYLILRGQGGGQPNLSQKILRSIRVPTPPLGEQAAIATFLDRETEKIDALISKVHKAIELLKELRTVLISAAVTGKIDVREEAGCT